VVRQVRAIVDKRDVKDAKQDVESRAR